MKNYNIFDKVEGGSILVSDDNIMSYICGSKADKLTIYKDSNTYKRSESFTVKSSIYYLDYFGKASKQFVLLTLKDVNFKIYINKDYIDYISDINKNASEGFTMKDMLVYMKDGDIYRVNETLHEIKERLESI